MATRDLSTEFSNVTHLLDLAKWLALDNMKRVSVTENVGYTLPHKEACQLESLLTVTADYANRVLREVDEAGTEAIEKARREFDAGGAS